MNENRDPKMGGQKGIRRNKNEEVKQGTKKKKEVNGNKN